MRRKDRKAEPNMVKVYRARSGATFSDARAQIYGEHLHSLLYKHGRLTPDLVVVDARKKSSPTHDYFEWNDTEAAGKYRLHQARMLMNSIELKVVIEEGGQTREHVTNAFVNVTDGGEAAGERRFYTSVEVALSNEEYTKQKLEEALSEIRYWRRKYDTLTELRPLFAALDAFLKAA